MKPVLTVPVYPGIKLAGVNSVYLLYIPIKVCPAQTLTITLELPSVSAMVSTSNPEMPWLSLYTGPARTLSVPS